MGVCASKPWEIDLRDTCQRLRCFFAYKIIVHTSEIDGSEPELEIQVNKKDLSPPSCLALFFTFMWANRM